jgi:1,4-dihydroxy-2-naphthoyl-CoA hydrolase
MEMDIQKANSWNDHTLMGSLGIRFTKIENGYLEATMPVDHRTHQPYGLLHGGASAALAETIGSYGSQILAENDGGICVGVELNINHIKSKRHGVVTGKGKCLHRGSSSHVWSIEIVDENDQLLAISRLTVLVKKPRV